MFSRFVPFIYNILHARILTKFISNSGDINWNFSTKFIVGRDGIPVQRFDKNQSWEDIEECIQTALNASSDENDAVSSSKADQKVNAADDEVEKKLEVETASYVFKSIDNANNKITCLDADFNDIVFDLDVNAKELLEKINKVIEEGAEQKKDVKIAVSRVKSDEDAVSVVSDAMIA